MAEESEMIQKHRVIWVGLFLAATLMALMLACNGGSDGTAEEDRSSRSSTANTMTGCW